ncbi:MAG: DoxX family membrane protein, partial [Bacteroidota bacterium]
MKKRMQSHPPLPIGIDLIRMITAGIIISFGLEIFDTEQMDGYAQWLSEVGMPLPGFMAYVGKVAELGGGFLLLIGLFT